MSILKGIGKAIDKVIHGDRISYTKPAETPYKMSPRNAEYKRRMEGAMKGAKNIGVGVGGQAPRKNIQAPSAQGIMPVKNSPPPAAKALKKAIGK